MGSNGSEEVDRLGGGNPAGPNGACASRILLAIRRIIRAMDLDSRRLAAEHEITGTQLLCLMAVVSAGEVTATEIARQVHLSPSTVVGVLDRLEAKGFLTRTRSREDRRQVRICPTAAGRRVISETPQPLQAQLREGLSRMGEMERRQIAASIEKIADLTGVQDVEAGPAVEITPILRGKESPGEP